MRGYHIPFHPRLLYWVRTPSLFYAHCHQKADEKCVQCVSQISLPGAIGGMRKKKKSHKTIRSEFIDKNIRYVSHPAIMNGRKGNVWSIWKMVDSEWEMAGKLFADKTTTKTSIILCGNYLYPDLHEKFSIARSIGRFRKALEYLIKKIITYFRKSP